MLLLVLVVMVWVIVPVWLMCVMTSRTCVVGIFTWGECGVGRWDGCLTSERGSGVVQLG